MAASVIRPAREDDVPYVVAMTQALAEHDGMKSLMQAKDLIRYGFSDDGFVNILVVEDSSDGASNGRPPVIGYTAYRFTYSTWEGRVVHIEDLFVEEQYRGRGHGRQLMQKCAEVAVANNCSRMNWRMSATNSRAAVLYDRIGGSCLRELKTFFLSKDAMQLFAPGTPCLKRGVIIRKATKEDVPAIVSMIKALAVFVREPEAVQIGEQDFIKDGFSDGNSKKYFHCFVAEDQSQDRGRHIIGYVFYFFFYSSWDGNLGLHLEDVYVEEEYRREGIGTELMRQCAKVAMETECCRMEWEVLDWNVAAIQLYQKLNATQMDELLNYRLSGDKLRQFASGK